MYKGIQNNATEKELILQEIKRLKQELDLCISINTSKINSDKMMKISRALDLKINEYYNLEREEEKDE